MRDYEVCLPENEDWCVPASLQTILRSRGIEISQTQIAENFPDFFEGSVFRGFLFDEKLIQEFFRKNSLDLRCKLSNPFLHFDLYKNTDLFLNRVKEAQLSGDNEDVFVAYNSKFHQQTEREQVPHVSIFLDYSFKSDLVRVTGIGKEPYKDISLPLLVRNMHPDKNENYGFYVIYDEQ